MRLRPPDRFGRPDVADLGVVLFQRPEGQRVRGTRRRDITGSVSGALLDRDELCGDSSIESCASTGCLEPLRPRRYPVAYVSPEFEARWDLRLREPRPFRIRFSGN